MRGQGGEHGQVLPGAVDGDGVGGGGGAADVLDDEVVEMTDTRVRTRGGHVCGVVLHHWQ